MEENKKYCKHCGEIIDNACVICPKCGKQIENLTGNNHNQTQKQTNGLGIAGMVIGIISLVTVCCGGLGGFLGIIGLILSVVGACSKNKQKSTAVAGIVCNSISILIMIIILAIAVNSDTQQENNNNTNQANNSQTNDQKIEPSSEPDEEINYTAYTVNEMMNDLKNNPLNASDKYKGQYIEITGRLGNIDSDGKYITLLPDDEWAITGVHCRFEKNNEEQRQAVASMTMDSQITLRGKCTDVGEVLGYTLEIDSID